MGETTHPEIVVGIDGSEANQAAVNYAIDLAHETGHSVRLVTAYVESVSPRAGRKQDTDTSWTVLADLERKSLVRYPDLRITTDLRPGDASDVLLAAAKGAETLVVGKRGLGTFGRLLLGSTSAASAGRTPVPVYVVPPAWVQEDHRSEPVLVGVDIGADEEETLATAFAEARRRAVDLHAVYAVDLEPMLRWDPTIGGLTYQNWQVEEGEWLDERLTPWRDRFPDVPVTARTVRGEPATALLASEGDVQLVVVGRHRTGPFGFGLGSRARAVLHYAETPVLVVPAP